MKTPLKSVIVSRKGSNLRGLLRRPKGLLAMTPVDARLTEYRLECLKHFFVLSLIGPRSLVHCFLLSLRLCRKAVLSKMTVESKDRIERKPLHYHKAGTIGKTVGFIRILTSNFPGRIEQTLVNKYQV